MAKLTDKFFNRVIEGDLELSSSDKSNNGITKVVANPTLAGTEAGLEGLEVSGTKYSVKKGAVAGVEGAPSGTLATVLGLDSNGKLAKGSVSGGTQLYKHGCDCGNTLGDYAFHFTFYSDKSYRFSKLNETNKTDFVNSKPLLSRDIVGLVTYGGSQYIGIITEIDAIQSNVNEWAGKLTVKDITNNQSRTIFISNDTVTAL